MKLTIALLIVCPHRPRLAVAIWSKPIRGNWPSYPGLIIPCAIARQKQIHTGNVSALRRPDLSLSLATESWKACRSLWTV
jgi:hypothetical protein